MICKACGTAHTTSLPGNGWIEATMWILIPLWPVALIYSIWRRTSRRRCAACGSTDLVALGTPVGRNLVRAHYPGGLPPAPVAAAPRAWRTLAWGLGAVVVLASLIRLLPG